MEEIARQDQHYSPSSSQPPRGVPLQDGDHASESLGSILDHLDDLMDTPETSSEVDEDEIDAVLLEQGLGDGDIGLGSGLDPAGGDAVAAVDDEDASALDEDEVEVGPMVGFEALKAERDKIRKYEGIFDQPEIADGACFSPIVLETNGYMNDRGWKLLQHLTSLAALRSPGSEENCLFFSASCQLSVRLQLFNSILIKEAFACFSAPPDHDPTHPSLSTQHLHYLQRN